MMRAIADWAYGIAVWAAFLVAYFVAVVVIGLALGQVIRLIDSVFFQ